MAQQINQMLQTPATFPLNSNVNGQVQGTQARPQQARPQRVLNVVNNNSVDLTDMDQYWHSRFQQLTKDSQVNPSADQS